MRLLPNPYPEVDMNRKWAHVSAITLGAVCGVLYTALLSPSPASADPTCENEGCVVLCSDENHCSEDCRTVAERECAGGPA